MPHSGPPDEEAEHLDADAIEAAATVREAWVDALRVRELECTDAVRALLGEALLGPPSSAVFVVALPIGNIVCRSWDQAMELAASWGDPGDDDGDDDVA